MQKFSVGKTLALAMFCWGSELGLPSLHYSNSMSPDKQLFSAPVGPHSELCSKMNVPLAAAQNWRDLMVMRALQGD
jgi:hypothetical protein